MSAGRHTAAAIAARALPAALGAVLLLGFAGCHKSHATQTPPECATRSDCQGGIAGGLLCVDGKCQGCTRSRDCRLTEACDPVQRRCTLKPCFGDACAAHDQCPLGDYCVQGLCLAPQKPLQQGGQTCAVQLCGSARDCNPGQRCNQRTFVCETDLGCASGAPCPADTACNTQSGQCEPSCTAETRVRVCGAFTPCIDGRCVQCASDADCGPGLSCNGAAGRCEAPAQCAQSRDCVVPAVCDRASGTCGPARGACLSNESCAPDERCESRSGKCVPGACQPDRFDPNGSAQQAAKLAPGSYPQLSLCGPAEEDWFSVALQSGDTVQVVSDADPLGSFDLQLQDFAGQVLAEDPRAVEHTVGSTATYYVRARTNDAAALYGLRVDVAHGTACQHSPATPHPTAAQALSVQPGPTYGLSVCPGEATWFSVRTISGQGVDAQLSLSPSAGGALTLTLFDSDGQTVLQQDQSGSAAPRVTAPSSRGNLFYLRVQGLTPPVQNRYDLVVRLVGP